MLSTDAFLRWSTKVVLFVHVTSHVDGEPHPDLLYELGGIGWPTMSFLDADGRLLKQVGNVTPLSALEGAWQELQGWRALRAEVERGGAGAAKEKELFLLELRMGNRPYDEMLRRRERLSWTEQEQRDLEPQLVNLQFTEILRATPRTPRARQAEGGKKFLAMFRAGRIPTASTETSFWQYMFAYAAAENDVKLFAELLAYIEDKRRGDRRLERYLPQLRAELQQLQQKQKDKGQRPG